jgi:glycerophosphoryl diester phosphodiesterase
MKNRPLLLGHRGARGEKSMAENTLASFDLALAQGCDGFEFDVRMAADGQAVICHDETTGRALKIADCSAEQLCLPVLRDVLIRYHDSAFLDIELKVAGLEKLTADLLKNMAPTRGYVLSSFLPDVLKEIHRLGSGIPLGLICETRLELARWRELPVSYVIPHFALVRQDLITELKAGNKKIFVWAVNEPSAMKRFAEWGVDGMISDYPDRLASTLAPR